MMVALPRVIILMLFMFGDTFQCSSTFSAIFMDFLVLSVVKVLPIALGFSIRVSLLACIQGSLLGERERACTLFLGGEDQVRRHEAVCGRFPTPLC